MVVSIRYASLARQAARHAEAFYLDELVRSVLLAANNVIAETMRADVLALSVLRGQAARTRGIENLSSHLDLGGCEAIKKDRDELNAVQKHARDVLENHGWRKNGKEVLLNLITRLDANMVTVERIKERIHVRLERAQVWGQ